MLGCRMISPHHSGRLFDCFFSAHVLEHLNCPAEMWQVARNVLRPNGALVAFLPNGNLARPRVHKLWGKVHPLLIDSDALLNMARSIDFSGATYTTPYDLQAVSRGARDPELSGAELAIVARRYMQPERKLSVNELHLSPVELLQTRPACPSLK